MFDPTNTAQLSRLKGAFRHSKQQLKAYNARAFEALASYVGPHYGQDQTETISDPDKYMNFVARAVDTYSAKLVPADPRVSVVPNPDALRSRFLQPVGIALSAHVNQRLKKERAGREFKAAVIQSMFGFGAVKVALQTQGAGEAYGQQIEVHTPYIQSILMEDLLIDVTAQSLDPEACAFIGHRYEVYLEDVAQDESFDAEGREQLQGLVDEREGGDRVGDLSTTYNEAASYLPCLHLWEVYLPRERLVLTMAGEDFGILLRTQKWTGPPRGPIHPICLRDVPGNALPRGIALELAPLDEALNAILCKLINQSARQKTFTTYQKGDTEDATGIGGVSDGQILGMNNPKAVTEVRMGGPDPAMTGFFMQLKGLLSEEGGNLDLLAGLNQATKTATQDSILNNNASESMKELADKVLVWMQAVLEDYTFWLYTDPVQTLRAEIVVPQVNMSMTIELTPDQRTHDFYMYGLNIEPFSPATKTPATRLQAIDQTLAQVAPYLQMMQQSGQAFDWGEYFKLRAEALGIPELLRLIKAGGVPLDQGSAAQPEPTSYKPHRTAPYERISSSPTNSPQALQAQQATMLMTSGGNAGERG